MKKIALLVLILVLALGTLGVAYAKWSQTVTINNNIATGTLTLQANTPTGTLVYKDLTTGAIDIVKGTAGYLKPIPATLPAAVASPIAGNNDSWLLIAAAEPTDSYPVNCTSTGITLNLAYANLFPIFTDATGAVPVTYDADFTITNTGSIPVKAKLGAFTPSNVGDLIVNWGGITEGLQIDPGQTAEVTVTIQVPDDAAAMNVTGSITGSINFVQWNEYTNP